MMPDPMAPDPRTQKIIDANRGHKPGRRIDHPDGTTYLVTETGAWERVTPRHFIEKHTWKVPQTIRNHGARRRMIRLQEKGR